MFVSFVNFAAFVVEIVCARKSQMHELIVESISLLFV